MYYEEKFENGKWYKRHSPKGQWYEFNEIAYKQKAIELTTKAINKNSVIPDVSNCDDIFEEASKCDIIEDECPKCGSNSVGVAFGMNECFDCQYEWA